MDVRVCVCVTEDAHVCTPLCVCIHYVGVYVCVCVECDRIPVYNVTVYPPKKIVRRNLCAFIYVTKENTLAPFF